MNCRAHNLTVKAEPDAVGLFIGHGTPDPMLEGQG
jgi:hypothetical protein